MTAIANVLTGLVALSHIGFLNQAGTKGDDTPKYLIPKRASCRVELGKCHVYGADVVRAVMGAISAGIDS